MNTISIPLCCDIVLCLLFRFSALVELEIVYRDRLNDAPRLLPLIGFGCSKHHPECTFYKRKTTKQIWMSRMKHLLLIWHVKDLISPSCKEVSAMKLRPPLKPLLWMKVQPSQSLSRHPWEWRDELHFTPLTHFVDQSSSTSYAGIVPSPSIFTPRRECVVGYDVDIINDHHSYQH